MWKIKLDYHSDKNMHRFLHGVARECTESEADYTYSYNNLSSRLETTFQVVLSDKYIWSFNSYKYPDGLWMKRPGLTAPFKRCGLCYLKMGISGRNTGRCIKN